MLLFTIATEIDKQFKNCHLAHICNHYLVAGILPCELRIANIFPVHKFGYNMIFTNFKHASVLPEKFEGLMQFESLCMSITMII